MDGGRADGQVIRMVGEWWMDEWWMDAWMSGWVDAWMSGWVDGCMDE